MTKLRILIAAALLGLVGYANADGISMITTAPSNALTSAHVYVGNGSNVATDVALSQDCTITNAGVVTCLKSNNVALGTGATANAGTGIDVTANAINSHATEHLDYQPGLITSVTNTKSVFAKLSKASTVDNLEGSASAFTCVGNPTVTMYECGTSSTCSSSPVTIGTVTVTAAGTVVDGTVSAPAITAGDYVAWAISAGTCTSLDIAAVAQVHAN